MSNDLGGVWRTVGGRRIFIKDGEDLKTAMKNSGKFKNLKDDDNGVEWKNEGWGIHRAKVDGKTHYIQGVRKTDGSSEYTKTIYDENGDEIYSNTYKSLEEAKNLEDNGEFKPRAQGSKTFEEHGVAFKDYETNKQFSDYLRDKYGTDDIDMITTGSEHTAESLRKDFTKKSYDAYVKKVLEDEEYLKVNRPNQYFMKMTSKK